MAWRGPVVSNAIRQFYSETNWGEIDYLFVDMPPGTSDVLLTVFQSLPVDGIVTVSAPQELVAMIVGKAVNLAHDMNVELLGLVENMAYFECPDCGKRHHIFGDPQGAARGRALRHPRLRHAAHRPQLRAPVRRRKGGGLRRSPARLTPSSRKSRPRSRTSAASGAAVKQTARS